MHQEAFYILSKWATRRGWTPEEQLTLLLRFIAEEIGLDAVEGLDRWLSKSVPEPKKAA